MFIQTYPNCPIYKGVESASAGTWPWDNPWILPGSPLWTDCSSNWLTIMNHRPDKPSVNSFIFFKHQLFMINPIKQLLQADQPLYNHHYSSYVLKPTGRHDWLLACGGIGFNRPAILELGTFQCQMVAGLQPAICQWFVTISGHLPSYFPISSHTSQSISLFPI